MSSRRLQEQGWYIGEDGQPWAGTITCHHCQKIVRWTNRKEMNARADCCRNCMKMVCMPCYKRGICTPWEKQFDRMEHRQRALRSYFEAYRS